MTDVLTTDDVRDIWVDYHLNPLPRAEGIALVPAYQQAFDAWLETIRADERAKQPDIPAVTRAAMDVAMPMIYDMLRAKVEALRDIDPHYQPVRDAYDKVLALFEGGVNPPDPIFGHDHGQ